MTRFHSLTAPAPASPRLAALRIALPAVVAACVAALVLPREADGLVYAVAGMVAWLNPWRA